MKTAKLKGPIRILWSLLLIIITQNFCYALDNGMGGTPPMGWNSWNTYGCEINSQSVREITKAMLSSGMLNKGYHYIIIDDCWQDEFRSPLNALQEDLTRFPEGMKQLIADIHALGLKAGLALGAGPQSCAGRPGSEGYEVQDAHQLVVEWGVDFIKYDSCTQHISNLRGVNNKYWTMRNAINATGRSVFYAMGNWGLGSPWHWGWEVANSWQTAGDVNEAWEALVRVADNSVGISRFAGKGGWNDLDVLLMGVKGIPKNSASVTLTETSKMSLFQDSGIGLHESKAQFAVWAIMKSPLFFTNAAPDLLSPDILNILGAEEVIAVNQDPLGVAADLVWQEGAFLVYACPLADGSRAVVLWNRHYLPLSRHRRQTSSAETDRPKYNLTLDFNWIGYRSDTEAIVRDLFLKTDLGTMFRGSYQATVAVHAAVMLKVTPIHEKDLDVLWRPWTYKYPSSMSKSELHVGDLGYHLTTSWLGLGLLGLGWLLLAVLCFQGWWRVRSRVPLKYSYLQLANTGNVPFDESKHFISTDDHPPAKMQSPKGSNHGKRFLIQREGVANTSNDYRIELSTAAVISHRNNNNNANDDLVAI